MTADAGDTPETIDRPWTVHYTPGTTHDLDYGTTTLCDQFDRAVRAHHDRPATEFFGRLTTYADLGSRVRRAAEGLRLLGVEKGDRVAVLLPNCPQGVVVFYAALRLGAIVVEHNPLYTADELEAPFADHGAKIVAKEDGDDGRGSLVCTKAVIIARRGNRAAKQALILVDCLNDGAQEYQEAKVAHRGLARIEQVQLVGGNGPVVMLARAVDPFEGLLMEQTDQTVMACDGFHQFHGDQVVVDRAVGHGEDRCKLVLRRSNLVVLGLGGDAELPERVIEFLHEIVDGGADSAEVVLFKLLTLAGRCAEQRAASQDKVLAMLVIRLLDQEVLLFGSDGGGDARHIDAEHGKRAYGFLRDGLHRTQKRRFLV